MKDQSTTERHQQAHVFSECVAKYNPQRYTHIHDSMLAGSVVDNTYGFCLDSDGALATKADKAGHLMLRRFKKN